MRLCEYSPSWKHLVQDEKPVCDLTFNIKDLAGLSQQNAIIETLNEMLSNSIPCNV